MHCPHCPHCLDRLEKNELYDHTATTCVDTYDQIPEGIYRLLTSDRSVQHCLRYVNLKSQECFLVEEELDDVNFVNESGNELYLVTYGRYYTTRYLPEVSNDDEVLNDIVQTAVEVKTNVVDKYLREHTDNLLSPTPNINDIPVLTQTWTLNGVYHVSNINRRESTRVAGYRYSIATYTSLDDGSEYISFFNNAAFRNVLFINAPTVTNCELYAKLSNKGEEYQYAPPNSTTDDLFKRRQP